MIEYIERGKAIAIRYADGINDDGVLYVPSRDVNNHLKSLPAADVRENVHGEWKEKIVDDPIDNCGGLFRRRFYCTVCGNWQTYGRPKFCPNCGANMRGEKRNEIFD